MNMDGGGPGSASSASRASTTRPRSTRSSSEDGLDSLWPNHGQHGLLAWGRGWRLGVGEDRQHGQGPLWALLASNSTHLEPLRRFSTRCICSSVIRSQDRITNGRGDCALHVAGGVQRRSAMPSGDCFHLQGPDVAVTITKDSPMRFAKGYNVSLGRSGERHRASANWRWPKHVDLILGPRRSPPSHARRPTIIGPAIAGAAEFVEPVLARALDAHLPEVPPDSSGGRHPFSAPSLCRVDVHH